MNEIIEKPFDWNNLIYKITEEVIETKENFIFTTIHPWCENVMQEKISKYDLERALALYFNGGTILDKIKAEIKEWYWQADKQSLAKDPCVVDAMLDLFIRTIDKYMAESEET